MKIEIDDDDQQLQGSFQLKGDSDHLSDSLPDQKKTSKSEKSLQKPL